MLASAAWTTFHADNARSGVDSGDSSFAFAAKAWDSAALDGKVYAEPLLLNGVVYVATENDSVYALDANSGATIWSRHLATPVTSSTLPCGNITPVTGITGTPVIDAAANRLFVVAFQSPGPQHVLYALDLGGNGATLFSRVVDPLPPFSPTTQQERSALTLSGGFVYLEYGGLAGDCGTYHGYVVAAREDNSVGPVYFNDQAAGGNEAGYWSASGAAMDASGSLYVASGNGSSTTTYDHGETVSKLNGVSLSELDHWAPANWASLNGSDTDIGSIGPALVGSGLLFQGGKDGDGRLLNTSNLGGTAGAPLFSAHVCTGVSSDAMFGGTAYLDPYIYVPCSNGLFAVKLSGSSFSAAWSHTGINAGPPIVAGGAVWTIDVSTGTLYALDSATGTVRYSTGVGSVTHFTTPTAGAAHVYVGVNSSSSLGQPHVTAYALMPSPAGQYHTVVPYRVLDTRTSGHPVGPNGELDFQVSGTGGAGGVPAGATAAVLNVTAVDTTAASFLTVWPAGTSRPNVSNLNFPAGAIIANLVATALSSSGQAAVFNSQGSSDVVVDVEGWVSTPAGAVSDGRLTPIVPYRVYDTRSTTPLGPGQQLDIQVGGTGGAGGVPAAAEAAVLNVTIIGATAGSFLTVWPSGQSRPNTSNLNFGPNQIIPNRVIVQLGSGGKISVFNAAGAVDVIVDANAWFTDPTAPAATTGLYTPMYPFRVLDTRQQPPAVGPGGVRTVTIAGVDGVPSSATAVVLNVTATDATYGSLLKVYPSDAAKPASSDLNFAAGQTIANLVVVKLSAGGQFSIYNELGTTQAIADVEGYFS